MLRFAYNTIGCAHHARRDALDLIAEAGYQGVTLTLDVHHMNPLDEDYEAAAERLAADLKAADLAVAFDANARFLLDPRDRQEPSLLSPQEDGRARRVDLIKRAIRICKICDGEVVSFTAGRVRRNVSQANAGAWLLDGLTQIADYGVSEGVNVALEPEPGHIVSTLDDFTLVRDATKQMTQSPLRLSLDVGHTMITGERSPHQAVKEFSSVLALVSMADMRTGVHAHLPLGEGDMDLPLILATLQDVSFGGLVTVKFPRDSHRADVLIPRSSDWLTENLPSD
ncbi:MAG: sugar phosphate isomerase/epimerase family protein [Pseudomonadota bacterium]